MILSVTGRVATVEVDGVLDLIGVHDLERAMESALAQGCRKVWLDLSRVPRVEPGCDAELRGCLAEARTRGARLGLASISAPLGYLVAQGGPLSNFVRVRRRHGKAV
ncbi:STAS domain-containing protein [Nocardioides ungokensis]|uniref:STAS domain-containing protein n=1 Tax=Nocardioides ungokensis TaxID=1643322 RepID=UPI0015DFD156|nr:STAS domain-containing protein [Nocardioides ungokensis]